MSKPKPKQPLGRHPFQPTEAARKQVEALAAYGIPQAEIASTLAITVPTLCKHFRGELDTGHVKANAKVAECLFKRATSDGQNAVTAQIFWLKCRAGWREQDRLDRDLGKKDQQSLAAQTAGAGTEWEDDLRPRH